MRGASTSRPDWRDATAYATLLDADRSLFAWEWLRRDPSYRVAARDMLVAPASIKCRGSADRFGLVTFEPPDAAVPSARPVWSADAHPYVLRVFGIGAGSSRDTVDLEAFSGLALIVSEGRDDHLLLSDGLHTIRLDAPRGCFAKGPVTLGYLLEGLTTLGPSLLTLRRLVALCRDRRFARVLHPREARARRWILMLRAWDALHDGADQREIAQVLLSSSAAEPRWRTREPSIRLQAQRLVRAARHMAAGQYRQLLGPHSLPHAG